MRDHHQLPDGANLRFQIDDGDHRDDQRQQMVHQWILSNGVGQQQQHELGELTGEVIRELGHYFGGVAGAGEVEEREDMEEHHRISQQQQQHVDEEIPEAQHLREELLRLRRLRRRLVEEEGERLRRRRHLEEEEERRQRRRQDQDQQHPGFRFQKNGFYKKNHVKFVRVK